MSVDIPKNLFDDVIKALDQLSNILYGGMFSIDKTSAPDLVKIECIKRKGEIEILQGTLYELIEDRDNFEYEAAKIKEFVNKSTENRLKQFNKKINKDK